MKSFFKEIFRTISTTKGKFITLIAIVILGVSFFVGLVSTPTIMSQSVDKYIDDHNVMDLQIYSNMGFIEEDIDLLSKEYDVYGNKFVDAEVRTKDSTFVLRIDSYDSDEYINGFTLVEGRMPISTNEILIEDDGLVDDKPEIGDTIDVIRTNMGNELVSDEFVVVGIIDSPYYMGREKGISTLNNLSYSTFAYVKEESFAIPYYNSLLIDLPELDSMDTFLEDYELEVNIAKEDILDSANLLPDENWIVNTRLDNYSISGYKDTISQMSAIGSLFPLFFFLVAALVCSTTMTRMIDEKRGKIGILRALGYSRALCAFKYLFYVFMACLIGGLIGSVIGMMLFPNVIFTTWELLYSLPLVNYETPWLIIIGSNVVFFVIILVTTFVSINSETHNVPSELMRPKAPRTGKVILLERVKFIWNKLSFTSKVTARNIFRYKKRFLMTVLGIAGCTALLIAGFGIKDSITGIVTKQYDELTSYQGIISLNNGLSNEQVNLIYKDVNSVKSISDAVLVNLYNITIDEHVVTVNVFHDNEAMLSSNNINVDMSNEGILISSKIAELLDLNNGDVINIESSSGTDADVTISTVFEKYVNHEIYMSTTYYEEIFDELSLDNSIFIMSDIINDVQDDILSIDNIVGLVTFDEATKNFDNMIKSLDVVIYVIIASAAALAFVVLINLGNVNIGERVREIATLKVLGFKSREVNSYIFRESLLLTFIGSLFGIVLGLVLHRFIILQVEMDFIMFIREVRFVSIVYSVCITLLFGFFVNLILRKSLQKIDMIESLKSVE